MPGLLNSMVGKVVLLLANNPQADPAAEYDTAVLATNPIAYWKLDEGTGTALVDSSVNALTDGTYTGITWDATGSRFGDAAPSFDGINDIANPYSAALQTAFNEDEGCILAWLKVSGGGVWTDATHREVFRCRDGAGGANYFFIRKTTTNNTLEFTRRAQNTITTTALGGNTGWIGVLMSWSVANDEFIVVANGVQVGATGTGVLAATAAITNFGIGHTALSSEFWSGLLRDVVVWDTPLASDLNDARVALTVG